MTANSPRSSIMHSPIGALLLLLIACGLTEADGQLREEATPANSDHQKTDESPATDVPDLMLTVPMASELMNVDLMGKERSAQKDVPLGGMEPEWSPDGETLAFVRLVDGQAEIYVMRRDTGAISNLTRHESDDRLPTWSPDGGKIAFMSTRTGDPEIFVMNSDGTGVENLSNNDGVDADPDWSPDGKKILYVSALSGGDLQLFVMNPDGSEQVCLFDDRRMAWVFPQWSPDGQSIAFGTYEQGEHRNDVQLTILQVETKSLSVVTDTPGINSFARWSPDSKYIAYVHIPGRNYAPTGVGADLMLFDVSTGAHTKLAWGKLPLWGPRPSWALRNPSAD